MSPPCRWNPAVPNSGPDPTAAPSRDGTRTIGQPARPRKNRRNEGPGNEGAGAEEVEAEGPEDEGSGERRRIG